MDGLLNYDDHLNPPDDLVLCEECEQPKVEGHPCRVCRTQAIIDREEEWYELRDNTKGV